MHISVYFALLLLSSSSFFFVYIFFTSHCHHHHHLMSCRVFAHVCDCQYYYILYYQYKLLWNWILFLLGMELEYFPIALIIKTLRFNIPITWIGTHVICHEVFLCVCQIRWIELTIPLHSITNSFPFLFLFSACPPVIITPVNKSC